jgi:hypothetical protein
MIQWAYGSIVKIELELDGIQWVRVRLDETGETVRAVCYPDLYGSCRIGEHVVINQTATQLGLGTGGNDYILRKEGLPNQRIKKQDGHIMKLRYTPLQFRVFAIEEEMHPLHAAISDQQTLENCPVVLAELHSMVPVVASVIQYRMNRQCQLVYVMTDGGALPAAFSHTIRALKEKRLISGVVTVGNAFGGDVEAVNLYSGLLAAKYALQADVIVVAMGPGIVGTNTQFGHSGIEQGIGINAVHSLQGEAIPALRCSSADPRPRHRGISHHTLTSLLRVALVGGTIGIPTLSSDWYDTIWRQIRETGIDQRYLIVETGPSIASEASRRFEIPYHSMGRTYADDPLFFDMAAAAGEVAVWRLGVKNSCNVSVDVRN